MESINTKYADYDAVQLYPKTKQSKIKVITVRKTIDELLVILKENYSEENIKNNIRKKRVYLTHLTTEEKQIYKKEWDKLNSRKYWKKNQDKNGVNQKKKEYYNKNKELYLMKAQYKYYLCRDRVSDFEKKYPDKYNTLKDLNFF
tara:strand:- start:53 stop:487 length:435 start_codon:yes stop_codon:yes gene_type:complete